MFSKKLNLFSCCLEQLMQLLIVFQGEGNLDLCFLKSLLLASRISLLLSKASQLDGSYWPYKKANYHIQLATVKPVLTNTFLKRPPVLNDQVVVFPQVFRSNFSLYSDHLYNATSDHSNDIPGFLLPAYNNHCTKGLFQKSRNSQDIFILIICCFITTQFLFQTKIQADLFLSVSCVIK